MGAYFNTQGTLDILGLLHTVYKANWNTTKTNGAHRRALGDHPATPSHEVCRQFGMEHPNGGVNGRWHRWLNHFDSHGGYGIRDRMAQAMGEALCDGIEFFAAPAPNFLLSTQNVPVAASPGHYTLAVVALTPIIDQLPAAVEKKDYK